MSTIQHPLTPGPNAELATFGAGCFWGTEKFYKKEFGDGLEWTEVGYMGGTTSNPSYKQVCAGDTFHAEVLQVSFKKDKVKYGDLVEFFYRMHNPTQVNAQGPDRGTQYRTVIFTHNEEQEKIAKEVTEKLRERLESKFGAKLATQIVPAAQFWKAEDYHQDYLDVNPDGYCSHKLNW